MFDPVRYFEDVAESLSLTFMYGAKPFQNWQATQEDLTDGAIFMGMFPFEEDGELDNGAVAQYSVSTILWVGRKFDPAGTFSSLDETERQKYDRRLLALRAQLEALLATFCGSVEITVTRARIFRELNRFDENTDVIGCDLSFTYDPNTSNSEPSAPTATAATNRSTTQFVANWNKLQAEGYYLDVATNSTFTSMVVTNRDCGNHEYSLVTGLTTGTTYYYRVRAYNDTGTSGNSNTITAVTL